MQSSASGGSDAGGGDHAEPLSQASIADDAVCAACGDQGILVKCSGCDQPYHFYCVSLFWPPDGAWHCPDCTDELPEAAQEVGEGGF